MFTKHNVTRGFLHALGAFVYVVFVGTVMQNGERLFGRLPGLLGPITFLTLFVVSAAIMGVLVVGKPLMLYLDGKKRDAMELLSATITSLVGIMFVLLLVASALNT